MIDILINFRTTYVKDSETLVTCPVKIAKHYLKTYFVVDFVAAIPWELIVGQQAEEVGNIQRLLASLTNVRPVTNPVGKGVLRSNDHLCAALWGMVQACLV